MFFEMPRNLILLMVGAFLLGWLLSALASRLGSKVRASRRDPRDNRIRSLEAELRVAHSDAEKVRAQVEDLEARLKEANEGIERRDRVIAHQQSKVDKMAFDLKESVRKTRELRAELTERATENVRSEVKLREVETELEVAHASTDLIATGILDYTIATNDEEEGVDEAKSRSSSG